MLSYEIDPGLLSPFLPAGTELDSSGNKHFVSVVGFLFLNTTVRGFAIPCHRNFEEVNLRFYVRRRAAEGWRRGVVFIRELVPRIAIATTARFLYNEKYSAVRMGHTFRTTGTGSNSTESVSYWFLFQGRRNEISMTADGEGSPMLAGTEQEFITEHFWGYAAQRDGSTLEYRVDHPRWLVRRATESRFDVDVRGLYGQSFEEVLRGQPSSAFLSTGSEVSVSFGERLSAP